jgi:hypothetical protein
MINMNVEEVKKKFKIFFWAKNSLYEKILMKKKIEMILIDYPHSKNIHNLKVHNLKVFLITYCKMFRPKSPFYEKVKMTTKKTTTFESFVILGSFDCDCTQLN